MEKSMNPSSRRSRRYITEALLGIMTTKPYTKISITEITEKADVVRRTFYRNFESKEDVLETYIYSIFLSLQEQLQELEEYDEYLMARVCFEYMARHKVFLNLLLENDLFILVLKVLEDHMDDFNRRFKGDRLNDFDPTFISYYSSYKTAGLWRILKKWLSSGMKESPEQMASYFENIITKCPDAQINQNQTH